MSENDEQGIIDLTPNRVAQIDQLRAQAKDGVNSAGRFMAMWGDGIGGVTYVAHAGDIGVDAIGFFAYCAARAVKTFAQLMELDDPAAAMGAILKVLEENDV